MNVCKIEIKNRIKTEEYRKAIRSVYAPNKGPITDGIVLPEGKVLDTIDAFFENNGEILKQAALNLNPRT